MRLGALLALIVSQVADLCADLSKGSVTRWFFKGKTPISRRKRPKTQTAVNTVCQTGMHHA